MNHITERPVARGLDIDKEKIKKTKTNLMTARETMTLIIIMTVMGVTCTLTHLGPFLSLPMTRSVRLNINYLVQILICMVETAETIQRQVSHYGIDSTEDHLMAPQKAVPILFYL